MIAHTYELALAQSQGQSKPPGRTKVHGLKSVSGILAWRDVASDTQKGQLLVKVIFIL